MNYLDKIRNRRHIFGIILFLIVCLCGGGCGGGGGGSSNSETGGGTSSGPGGTTGGTGGTTGGTDGTISLAWDANSEPDVAGYRIYYGTNPGSCAQHAELQVSNPASGTTVSYTLTGLTKGQTYFIAVTDYDTSNNESDFSNEVSGIAG